MVKFLSIGLPWGLGRFGAGAGHGRIPARRFLLGQGLSGKKGGGAMKRLVCPAAEGLLW